MVQRSSKMISSLSWYLFIWFCLVGRISLIVANSSGLPSISSPIIAPESKSSSQALSSASTLPSTTSVYETRSSRRKERQELERQQKLEKRRAKKGLSLNSTDGTFIEDSDSGERDDEDEEDDEDEVDEFSSDMVPTTRPLSTTNTVSMKQVVVEVPVVDVRSPWDEEDDEYEDEEEEEGSTDFLRGLSKRRRGRYYRLGMRSISTSLKSLTSSTRQVFSKMVYKGVGLSFVKPIGGNWKSFGVGVKVPITNHFPLYDSNICLPRLVGFVGVNYPLSYKVSLTLSVPIQAVQIYLLILSQANPSQWPQVKATDNVKRLGLTWSLKIPAKFPSNKVWYKALSSSWGPVFNFLPGSKMIQAIMPFLLITPTLLLTMVLYLHAIGKEMTKVLSKPFRGINKQRQQQQPSITTAISSVDSRVMYSISSVSPMPSTTALHGEKSGLGGGLPSLVSTQQSMWQLENSLMTRFDDATNAIKNWLSQRSTALGSAFGYSNHVRSLSVNFDLQPFYLLFIRTFVTTALSVADRILFVCLDTFFYAIFAMNQRLIQWRKTGRLFAKRSPMKTPVNDQNPTSMSYERVSSFSASPDSFVNPREFASKLKARKQHNIQQRGGNKNGNSNGGKNAENGSSQSPPLMAQVSKPSRSKSKL